MNDYEKLGAFYLGKTFDFSSNKINEEPLLYDSKDLTTHAVCVGMTGSGKTGLCITLLEEAAIDNIPSIVIDPKGDITNLLLTFPDLKPEDFLPWINESDASRENLSPDEFAKKQAELWRNGLAKWDQSPERIKRLKDSADFEIYTPGSNAGSPVSIIHSFDAPPKDLLADNDLVNDRISTTVSSLLGLVGIDADPIRSKEHILISSILKNIWDSGKNLDLPSLIQAVQRPPMDKIGVFDLDSFFSANERFELAMSLNNLLSAPSFQSWLEGSPLNINEFLYTKSGKPRISIFYIAHLSDPERMFFMSMLLNELMGWMRQQSGTTSLRAIFYVDEIFGYLPPVANPPSKKPFLTLLKQGRAFGLGTVLATQNPVDLDYKSLSNSGTWFIGRLQTDRDRQRVLDGLEGAASSGGNSINRKEFEQILSNLDKRVFLLHNVNENQPAIFHTRWAMSYLRGPLTRMQIKKLSGEKHEKDISRGSTAKSDHKAAGLSVQPVLSPDIPQYFLPLRGIIPQGAQITYQPYIAGEAAVNFSDTKKNITFKDDVFRVTPLTSDAVPVIWDNSFKIGFDSAELEKEGREGAIYNSLPEAANKKSNFTQWDKDFVDFLYRSHFLELLKSNILNENSLPGESERDFKARIQLKAREQRDAWIEKIRENYAKKTDSIQAKILRAEDRIAREESQSSQQKLQTVISVGATILGALLGRKAISTTTVNKAGTAIRTAGRAVKESQDVSRAKDDLEQLKSELLELENELKNEIETETAKFDVVNENLERFELYSKKKDITTRLLALIWIPALRLADGASREMWLPQ